MATWSFSKPNLTLVLRAFFSFVIFSICLSKGGRDARQTRLMSAFRDVYGTAANDLVVVQTIQYLVFHHNYGRYHHIRSTALKVFNEL